MFESPMTTVGVVISGSLQLAGLPQCRVGGRPCDMFDRLLVVGCDLGLSESFLFLLEVVAVVGSACSSISSSRIIIGAGVGVGVTGRTIPRVLGFVVFGRAVLFGCVASVAGQGGIGVPNLDLLNSIRSVPKAF